MTPAEKPPPAKDEKRLDNKSLRTIEAILRTGFDPHTKLTLMAMAMDLNTKRQDWVVWRGRPSLSQRTSLNVDTLSKIRAYSVKEGVLVEHTEPHPMQIKKAKKEKGFAGRPASTYGFDIEHLESLGFRDDRIVLLRDSRSKKRLQARQDRRRQVLEDAEHSVAIRDDMAWTLRRMARERDAIPGGQYGPNQIERGKIQSARVRRLEAWHRRQRGDETRLEIRQREEREEREEQRQQTAGPQTRREIQDERTSRAIEDEHAAHERTARTRKG